MPACFERKSIFVAPDGWMLAKEFGHDGPFGQTFCFQTNPGIHSLITSIGSSARNRGSVRTQVFLEHETGKLPIIPADDNRTVLGDINARRN